MITEFKTKVKVIIYTTLYKCEHFTPQNRKNERLKETTKMLSTRRNESYRALRLRIYIYIINTLRASRDEREKKIHDSPLGKSNAKSATCVFALVTLSFAIKMRPRIEFEYRSEIVGPSRGTFFMPNFSNCFVDWSTWRIDFASSLIAINEAYGGGSSSSSSTI